MPVLFHWSPAERRAAIARRGLRVNTRPTCDSARYGRICLSPSPSHAWAHSAAIVGVRGQDWDLWQVVLDHDDNVEVVSFTGTRLGEVRVRNHIPKSRIWHVGTRQVPIHGRRF